MKFILARKLGMTTIYGDDGIAQNVTVLDAGKNIISGIRKEEKDGYNAIQVSFEKENGKGVEKAQEFRVEEATGDVKIGDVIQANIFELNEDVTVIGITKGKGFQGVVKRHGFSGSPATHGHRHDLRAPGSIGSAFPQHVFKGKKMAGRMGSDQKTIKNLKVAYIDEAKNYICIKGAVPGNKGSLVKVVSQ